MPPWRAVMARGGELPRRFDRMRDVCAGLGATGSSGEPCGIIDLID